MHYNLFNPVYNGPLFTQLSENRNPITNDKVRNWGDTFSCTPAQIYYPQTNEDVQKIVLNTSRLRVVGGGHSFSPLVCTEDTLVSLSKMTAVLSNSSSTVTAQAGITIENLLVHVLQSDKIIHGFGSIQDQTLAGAFSTSHHGLTFHSFAEEVVFIKAVLANGSMVETDDLFYWRSSLGMLGIITEVTMKTHPNTYVNIDESKINIDDAIAGLITGDAGIIETNYNQREIGLLKRITFATGDKSPKYPVHTDHFVSAMWDTFVIPLIVLIPSLSEFPLLDFRGNQTKTSVPIVEAWSHHAEYGMQYSAYAIPLENCSAFIRNMDASNHSVSTLLIRYVPSQQNSTCLTFAMHDSCVIDVYDLQVQTSLLDFHRRLEANVTKYGGTSHWGKFYISDLSLQVRNMPCYEDFKRLREEYDPHDKFLNRYTEEIVKDKQQSYVERYGNTMEHYEDKTRAFRIVFFASCICYVIVFICFSRKVKDDGYKLVPEFSSN